MNSRYHERFSSKKISMLPVWMILLLYISLFYAPLACAEDPFFSIALSNFNSEQDAAKEETKLKNAGHNAFYRKEKSPDNKKTLYQVYIEKYNTRDEAEKEARVLKDLELISDYSVREVRETPLTALKQNTPAAENNTEASPIPKAAEGKKQPLKPDTVTEGQTAAPEHSPAAITKPGIVRSEVIKKTKPETESSPGINKAKIETKTPSAINKPEPKAERPPKANKPEQKPVKKPEKKAESSKKVIKPEPVINHDDTRLTESSLQVGAFSDQSNAEDLKLKLKNLGRNAFYRHESVDNKGEYYRLYITGYSSLREAVKDAKALVKLGVISSYSRVHSRKPFPDDPFEAEGIEKEGKTYFLHISSNKDETNAAENVANLKKHGYKAFYVLEKDNSVSWYRVYIGEFKDEAEARKKGKELFGRGLISSYFKPIVIDRKKLDN